MKSTPLFDLMCALQAESIKAARQYAKAIEKISADAADQVPAQAAEIHFAAKAMINAIAIMHAEAQRVLENGGRSLASDRRLLSLTVRPMLGDLTALPAAVLSASHIRERYIGWDSVLEHCQRAEMQLIEALTAACPANEPPADENPRAA